MDSVDYYNRHAAGYYERTVELDMRPVLERFTALLPDGAAVLDLGCGSGRDSLFLIENGFDVTALDASEELCELAAIHIGQEVLWMRYEEMDFKEVFDGVWACASLLHIPGDKIDSVLDKVTDGLKPGGILYMSFQYGEGEEIREGRYYKDYNTKSIKELVSRHKSLELLDLFKTDDIRPDFTHKEDGQGRWMNVLLRKQGPNE